MKKVFNNIRTLAALLIAGAAIAACSSDDNIIEDNLQPTNGDQTYTLIIKASKDTDNATTRALKLENNGSITPYWETGEQVSVYMGSTLVGTLTATVNNDGTTFSGEITGNFEANSELTLYYHKTDYAGQDGKLSTIASNFDQAVATITISEVDKINKTITIANGDNITFTSKQAIVKFTLKDDGSNSTLSPTSLKVTLYYDFFNSNHPELGVLQQYGFDFNITVAADAYTTNGAGTLYLALPKLASIYKYRSGGVIKDIGLDSQYATLAFEATVGNKTYYGMRANYNLENGKYYTSTLKMSTVECKLLHALTANEIGWRVGRKDNLDSYGNGIAYAYHPEGDLPSGVTAVAMIAYVKEKDETNNCTHGLAIALADENGGDKMTWAVAKQTCDQDKNIVCPILIGTWRLPTFADWQNMFVGCGSDPISTQTTMNYGYLSGKLIACGTPGVKYDDVYWSATENGKTEGDTSYAWGWIDDDYDAETHPVNGTTAKFNNYKKVGFHYARACLAF